MQRSSIRSFLKNPKAYLRNFYYSTRIYLLKKGPNISCLKSLYYSKKFANGSKKLTVIATQKGVIKVAKNARLNIGDILLLGKASTRVGEIGQTRYDIPLIQIAENGTLNLLGQFALIPGGRIIVGGNATVTIGNGSFVSYDTLVICRENISIGENCAISWGCQILDTDFHSVVVDNNVKENTLPIVIEDNVWVGSKSIILKGVTVGSGSVIASGAVVTKDVPPNSLVAGNPAKVIKENIAWEF